MCLRYLDLRIVLPGEAFIALFLQLFQRFEHFLNESGEKLGKKRAVILCTEFIIFTGVLTTLHVG